MSEQKRALITGITGQDGTLLSRLLLEKKYQVFGLSQSMSRSVPGVEMISGKLTDSEALNSIIENIQPHELYNFAAPSFVGASWDAPIETADASALGVARILESLRRISPKTRFYQASSSEMFGNAVEAPQTEQTRFRPRSPYGVSKVFAHHMTVNYREHLKMHATSGILYNHESELRPPEFVTRKITSTAAKIKAGLAKELRLGNLDAIRDWGYAGDYVQAIWLMLQQDEADDYIVSTGEPHTVREFVEAAFSRLDLDYRDFVKVDEKLYRPNEKIPLIGNNSKAKKQLNWQPQVNFKSLVHQMVDADWAKIKKLTDPRPLDRKI